MGCIRRVFGSIFSHFRRTNKKRKSQRNIFSKPTHTEVSASSSSAKCESNEYEKDVDSNTRDTDASSCEAGPPKKLRKNLRKKERHGRDEYRARKRNKKRHDTVSDSTSYERRPGKIRAKNIRGESVIIEKPREGRNQRRNKNYEEDSNTEGLSEMIGSLCLENREEKCNLRDRYKEAKDRDRDNREKPKRRPLNRNSDVSTDYSFIIDNYIDNGYDTESEDFHRKKDYSILLKNRMCEYIESITSHEKLNADFFK